MCRCSQKKSNAFWRIRSVFRGSLPSRAKDTFFIGHGVDYAISLEDSLKMKEINYIYSEAYAVGELKHGISILIDEGTLVIGILTQQSLYEKNCQQHAGEQEV